ncbi:MAG: helix-turn-helix domain-containing protein [Chloroflexota bacterium]
MSLPEAARRLGRDESTVRRMIDDGRLPGTPRGKTGAHRKVSRAAVEALAATSRNYSSVSARLANFPTRIWSSRMGPALLILDHRAIRDEVKAHVHLLPDWIDFVAIYPDFQVDADITLVEAAHALYDGSVDLGLGRLIEVLRGERLLRVALAIELLEGSIDHWEAFRIIGRHSRR